MLSFNNPMEHEHDKGCFPPQPPRHTMQEDMLATMHNMNETINRLLNFEQRLKSDYDTMEKHLCSDNVMFKNTMRDAWTTFLEEVKNEVNLFESNVDNTIALWKSDIESNYATLSEDTKMQIANALEEFNTKVEAFEGAYEEAFLTLSNSMQEQYSSFVEAVNGRIDNNNTTHEQAFADYQRRLTTELNTFETSINTQIETFTESVGNTIHTFKETWESIITQRLADQDAKLDDAELYMRTNLTATVTTLIGDMKDSGELVDIIEGEVFNDLEAKIGDKYVDINKYAQHCREVIVDGKTFISWSDAIEICINSCEATGKEIYFPSGTYYIDKAIVPKLSTVIKGSNASTTVIKLIPNSNVNAIELNDCIGSGFMITDICISGDYDHETKTLHSTVGCGVVISTNGECDNIHFNNVVIENFAEHGVKICEKTWTIRLLKCVLRRNKKYGLYLDKASDNTFSCLSIYQNGYGGIYTYLGGNNRYSDLKIYLNSRDCENADVDPKYLAGFSSNMTSLETFNNIEFQENYKHGFMIGGSSNYALKNIMFDANGFENSEASTNRDLYIWGSRNIHGDVMLSSMKENRGILDYRIYTSVNTKNINIAYYKSDDVDVEGSVLQGDTHITEDATTENVRVVNGYSM